MHLFGSVRTNEKRDIPARLSQATTEIPADGSGTDN
jgi:hypothetical protein